MKKTSPRVLGPVLAVLAIAVVAAQAPAVSAQSPLPRLPLRSGTPFTYCLTDASAKALRTARIEIKAVAPATLVTEKGNRCVRSTIESGELNSDLTGLTASAKGGFVLTRGRARAEFREPSLTLKQNKTGTVSWSHLGKRIALLTSTSKGVKVSLTKVSAAGTPMNLTPTGANALAKQFGTSPVAAGKQFFAGSADFEVIGGTLL